MLQNDVRRLNSLLDGKSVDFYLEDDMFEIEGKASVDPNDRIFVHVERAVSHVLNIAGRELELETRGRRIRARRTDTGQVFEIEINRIYDRLENPQLADLEALADKGIRYFFHKETDTLIWFEEAEQKWMIEFNKINMFFNGVRTAYETLAKLYEKNEDRILGVWQAVTWTSEVEEDQENYG